VRRDRVDLLDSTRVSKLLCVVPEHTEMVLEQGIGDGELTAKTGKAVSETQTPCKNQAPANLVGDFLISSKRESEPALWMRWKRKLLGEGFRKSVLLNSRIALDPLQHSAVLTPLLEIRQSAWKDCSELTCPNDRPTGHRNRS